MVHLLDRVIGVVEEEGGGGEVEVMTESFYKRIGLRKFQISKLLFYNIMAAIKTIRLTRRSGSFRWTLWARSTSYQSAGSPQ